MIRPTLASIAFDPTVLAQRPSPYRRVTSLSRIVPVQQGVDPSSPNPPQPRLRSSAELPPCVPCSSTIGCIQRRPTAGRLPLLRRLVLPLSVPDAPAAGCAGICRAGPLPRASQAGPPPRRPHLAARRPCWAAAAPAVQGCSAAPRPAAPLCLATAPAAPVQVAPPQPALLPYVSELTGPDSPTH